MRAWHLLLLLIALCACPGFPVVRRVDTGRADGPSLQVVVAPGRSHGHPASVPEPAVRTALLANGNLLDTEISALAGPVSRELAQLGATERLQVRRAGVELHIFIEARELVIARMDGGREQRTARALPREDAAGPAAAPAIPSDPALAAAPGLPPPPTQVSAPIPPPPAPASGPAPRPGSVSAGRRVALVIGNGRYRHGGPLANPPRDAAAMSAKLQRLGFQVKTSIDQGRSAMEGAVRSFIRGLDGADLALLYYAGHGLQVGGRNYLVPVDARLEHESDLEFETLDVERIIEPMQEHAKVGLVFLDACRNNPLVNRLKSRSRAIGRGLVLIQAESGDLLVAYATSPGSVAEDGDGENSPFTQALLEHIGTPGLEVQIMLKRVIRSVEERTGGRQRPWQNASLRSEVYLAGP